MSSFLSRQLSSLGNILIMLICKSENSASAEALLATTTMSYRKCLSVSCFLNISRRRRLILFLTTAFPTFLLTARPSLQQGSSFGNAYIISNFEGNFDPSSKTFLKSPRFVIEQKTFLPFRQTAFSVLFSFFCLLCYARQQYAFWQETRACVSFSSCVADM